MPKATSTAPAISSASAANLAGSSLSSVDSPSEAALPSTYEAGLQELERLVNELESGQLPLDRLLGSYQRGAALLTFCREKLQAVEDQIKVLDAGTLKAWSAE